MDITSSFIPKKCLPIAHTHKNIKSEFSLYITNHKREGLDENNNVDGGNDNCCIFDLWG